MSGLIVGAVAGIVAIVLAWMKGRAAGRDSVTAERSRKNETIRKEFEKVDAQPPSVDSALERLRKRAARRSGSGSQ